MTETAGDKTTTKAYTYGDSEWLDLLTAINGSAIRYDAGGNPTNWSNGKADLSLQWANGRRLTGASSESARKSESLSYAYDADGVRTSKSYTVKTYNVIPDYVVTFVADGKTVKTMTVEQGYKLKDSDYPTVPAKTGYTGEWKKYTTAISTDVTVVAVYTKIAARHTVTFKADGKVLKTMTVRNGYILKDSDYPSIPVKKGYTGSWPKTVSVIRADTVISAIYKSTGGGGITVPTRPSGEIMSVDEVEPIEAEAAEENAVAPQGTHLASTQTITHEYLTQSGKVMRETVKTDGTVTSVLDFTYDESGKPFAMVDQLSAQPKTYYYVLNLQGDVVKLVTDSGAVAASYEYDAWGNILASSGSMAEKNPLRYRSYYYDSETGFYYLQSRYYDPATRRFINADVYASTGQGFIGTNMFAYCGNNPMCYSDPDGMRYIDPNVISHGNGAAEYTDTATGGEYRRSDAVAYAPKYYNSRNSEFYSYSTDCANFVSQCLLAGGFLQTDAWHMKKTSKTHWYNPAAWFSSNYRYDWDVSAAWSLADAQYEYFSNLPGNTSVSISSPSEISSVVKFSGVQAGDLLYFANKNGVHHATIITKVENGMIYYAGHTRSTFDEPLDQKMNQDSVYIVIIGR